MTDLISLLAAAPVTALPPDAAVAAAAAALSEERGTLEDVIEPYLIQQGYIVRSARGRMATGKAYLHLGLPAPRRPDVADLFGG